MGGTLEGRGKGEGGLGPEGRVGWVGIRGMRHVARGYRFFGVGFGLVEEDSLGSVSFGVIRIATKRTPLSD